MRKFRDFFFNHESYPIMSFRMKKWGTILFKMKYLKKETYKEKEYTVHGKNMIRAYSQRSLRLLCSLTELLIDYVWIRRCTKRFLTSFQMANLIISLLVDCGFESRYCHLNFRFGACFEQGVPWNSGNYRV